MTVSSILEIEKANSTSAMPCPCCGENILLTSINCKCGARFVGAPLDERPLRVQRLGPALTSLGLLALVVCAGLVATKWFAFAGVLVIWSAWRAVRLAKHNPEWYGGYKTAAATLTITVAAGAGLATYGLAHIPKALDNFHTRRVAATQSAMYHYYGALEEYKSRFGSFPKNAQDFGRLTGVSLPADDWDRSIKYQSYTDAIADRLIGVNGVPFSNFELRSAGADGILGNDDDVVMRDGLFFNNSEVKKLPTTQPLR
jgi:hypothetical protein